jgi:hypothetical protein
VISLGRIATAFAVSPAASALVIVATLSAIGRALPSPGYILTVAALACGAAIVLGIPAFLLSRSWNLHSVGFYIITATVVSAPLLVVAAMLTGGLQLSVVSGLGPAIGGVIFHGIVERRPNYRWSGP